MTDSFPIVSQTTAAPRTLHSALADDPDLRELLQLFVDELPGKIEAMRRAIDEARIETLTRLAHQLKGAGGGYGYPAITDAAKALEADAREQADVDRLQDDLTQLNKLCQAASRGLTNL